MVCRVERENTNPWRPIFDREDLMDAIYPMLADRCPPPYDREGCPVREGADWSCAQCRAEWLDAIVPKATDVPDVLPGCATAEAEKSNPPA